MANKSGIIPAAEAFHFDTLITPTQGGIASRVLARSAGGNVTLFAFDDGEELSEHTAPFDALLLVLAGAFDVTVGGNPVAVGPGSLGRLPAHVPHAVQARERSRMLLVMLRDKQA